MTYLEDALDVLARRVLVDARVGEAAHHVVDGADDVQHLVTADVAVAVDVVEAEDPLQLLRQRAA